MPLINRIEVSNFINSDRNSPWIPQWPHAVFELLGFNSIINMPNGSGKTAMVSTALCCLSGAGRQMSKLRNIFFAPKSYGIYTHVRLQVTLDTVEGVGFDLFSGAPQGLQMVFGVFGRSGDEERHNFYSYAGTFEDCPVNQPDPGNLYRKNLISDKDFEDRLATMTGRFPANTREATDTAWKAYVQKWGFDTESIEQQLTYQLNAGGEGESSYFAVNPPQNMSYSAGVFYKHLAPQLLTDVMGGHGEDDEKGIEDTIHEKAMRVVHAQMQCDRQKEHLDEAKLMLDAIDRIREAADEVAASKNDILECRKNLGVELAVLKNITVDSPIPGLPPRLPEGLPAVAEYLVLCGGVSYLSDRGLAAFTGEEPKNINRRAMRQNIQPADIEYSQLIEIACHLDFSVLERKHTGGHTSKFYNKESVLAILPQMTDNYLPGITRESAIADIETAFTWVKDHADTNPARILRKGLEKERNDKRAELEQVTTEYAGLLQEKARLLSDKEHASGQLAEFLRMERSGLFSSEELASPENTVILTAKAESEATEALSSHRQQVARSEQVYVKWQDFIAQYGVDADPEKVREELAANEESSKESLTLLRSHRSILIQNRKNSETPLLLRLRPLTHLAKGWKSPKKLFPWQKSSMQFSLERTLPVLSKE